MRAVPGSHPLPGHRCLSVVWPLSILFKNLPHCCSAHSRTGPVTQKPAKPPNLSQTIGSYCESKQTDAVISSVVALMLSRLYRAKLRNHLHLKLQRYACLQNTNNQYFNILTFYPYQEPDHEWLRYGLDYGHHYRHHRWRYSQSGWRHDKRYNHGQWRANYPGWCGQWRQCSR
jgi:hypothetical protein